MIFQSPFSPCWCLVAIPFPCLRGLYWAAPALPLHRVYDYEPLERLKRLGLRAEAVPRLRGVQANLWTETVESEERAQEGEAIVRW